MNDASKSRAQQLLAELTELRRLVTTLESAAIEHQHTEQRLLKEALVSDAALKRSEATARAVFESATEGILLIDAAGRITLVNAAAERMFGYAPDELVGQPLEVLLPDRIRDTHREHRVRYFAGPRVRPMGTGLDLAGRRKDGTEFAVEISLSYAGRPRRSARRPSSPISPSASASKPSSSASARRFIRPRSSPRSARCRPASSTR